MYMFPHSKDRGGKVSSGLAVSAPLPCSLFIQHKVKLIHSVAARSRDFLDLIQLNRGGKNYFLEETNKPLFLPHWSKVT